LPSQSLADNKREPYVIIFKTESPRLASC